MKLEQAKSLLSAEQISQAESAGKEWGYQEADLWRDQHLSEVDEDGERHYPSHPEWTMGTYCGSLADVSEEQREAYELVLDCAARDAWNKYIDDEDLECDDPEAADATHLERKLLEEQYDHEERLGLHE